MRKNNVCFEVTRAASNVGIECLWGTNGKERKKKTIKPKRADRAHLFFYSLWCVQLPSYMFHATDKKAIKKHHQQQQITAYRDVRGAKGLWTSIYLDLRFTTRTEAIRSWFIEASLPSWSMGSVAPSSLVVWTSWQSVIPEYAKGREGCGGCVHLGGGTYESSVGGRDKTKKGDGPAQPPFPSTHPRLSLSRS